MKYIKLFENLTKKTLDTNKIYVYTTTNGKIKGIKVDIPIDIIGKIDTKNKDFYGSILGFDSTGQFVQMTISHNNWKRVREATPEEIKKYNFF